MCVHQGEQLPSVPRSPLVSVRAPFYYKMQSPTEPGGRGPRVVKAHLEALWLGKNDSGRAFRRDLNPRAHQADRRAPARL